MNNYDINITVKFSIATDTELDGASFTDVVRSFMFSQFMPKMRTLGWTGGLFSVDVEVVEKEPDSDDSVPDLLKQAMADYLERRVKIPANERCKCPTCQKVAALTDRFDEDKLRQFVNWLRTGEPIEDFMPDNLLKILLAIGEMSKLETQNEMSMPQLTPGVHLN